MAPNAEVEKGCGTSVNAVLTEHTFSQFKRTRAIFTQEDLPSICEHLIQINPVSLAQERSALGNTWVFTVNTFPSSTLLEYRTFKSSILTLRKI